MSTTQPVATRPCSHPDFEHLYRTYYPGMYRHIFRVVKRQEVAEDLAQDVFVKLIKAGVQFETERQASAWLYRTATTTAIDEYRRYTSRIMCELIPQEVDASLPESSDATLPCELREQLQGLLTVLSPQEMRCFALLAQGYQVPDIARAVSVSHTAMKMRLIRARQKVQAFAGGVA